MVLQHPVATGSPQGWTSGLREYALLIGLVLSIMLDGSPAGEGAGWGSLDIDDDLPRRMTLDDIEGDGASHERTIRGFCLLDGIREQDPVPQGVPRDPPPFDPPHGSFAGVENHFSGKAWKEEVWDGYLTQPMVLLPAGLALSAAAISHWDRRLQRHWEGSLSARGHYSDYTQDTLIGAVVLIGAFLPGEGRNWWDEWWTIGEAYVASTLTTFVTKAGVKRPRPGRGLGSAVGTHSFPSGHSTSAFTAATLIESNSGPLLGLPAYGLAAFTAFERVDEGRHYPSDVLAGAAVGILSASIFDHLHWGSGPGGGGIARPPVDARFGFVDGLHGFEFEITLRF